MLFQVLLRAERQLKEYYDVTDAQFQHSLEDQKGGLCCSIADPTFPEAPLVYVSPGFEEEMGYSADFALGRSCRSAGRARKRLQLLFQFVGSEHGFYCSGWAILAGQFWLYQCLRGL